MLWNQKLFPNEGSNSRKVFNLFYTHLLSVYVLGGGATFHGARVW